MSDIPILHFTQSYAYLIGINNYQSDRIKSLKTAVEDAIAVAQKLDGHGYQPILLLDDGRSEENLALFREYFGEEADAEAFVLDQTATKANIEQLLLTTIKDRLTADDRVIFYFAGHGIADDLADEDDEKPQGYLMPVDSDADNFGSLVSMETVNEALADWHCRHGLLILDCCFAGSFQWTLTGTRGDIAFPQVIFDRRFEQYGRDPAWQVITSSAADQKAVDIFQNRVLGQRDHDGDHSPFAQALLDGLAGAADLGIVEGEADGVITATELYLYLRQRVELATMDRQIRQTPSIFNLAAKHDKGEFLFLNPASPLSLPKFSDFEPNPYRGLAPYREEDAIFLYGRDAIVQDLSNRLGKIGAAQRRLVILSGGNGGGKTSVVQAGLIPLLKRSGWTVLPVIQPSNFLQDKEEAFFDAIIPQISGTDKTLLVIDQYEEVLTKLGNRERWVAFENAIIQLLEEHARLYVLLVIRNSLEYQLQRGPIAEAGWWQSCRFALPNLRPEELREIIVRPVEQAVLFYQPASLADQILDEVDESPESLPMLAFTLHQLVSKIADGRALTAESYRELGGVGTAIWTQADQVFDGFEEGSAQQKAMKKIMLRLVRIENGTYQKRMVPYLVRSGSPSEEEGILLHELDYPENSDDLIIEEVITALTEARLIHQPFDASQPNQLYIEPIHDALITAWPKLHSWIEEIGTDQLRLRRQLWEAALEYQIIRQVTEIEESHSSPDIKLSTSFTWENNSKLAEVLQAIFDPEEKIPERNNPVLTELAMRLWNMEIEPSDINDLRQLYLLFPWRENVDKLPERKQLQEGKLSLPEIISILLRLTDHWLNETELAFVEESWQKRQSRVAKLRADRDDAIRRATIAEAHIVMAQAQALQRHKMPEALRRIESAWDQLKEKKIEPTPILQTALANVFYTQFSGRDFPYAQPLPSRILSEKENFWDIIISWDQQFLLTTHEHGVVKLWDVQGDLIRTCQHENDVAGTYFVPANVPTFITTTTNGHIWHWIADREKPVLIGDKGAVPMDIQVSPKGQYFILLFEHKPSLLCNSSGKVLEELKEGALYFAFSPSDRYLLILHKSLDVEFIDLKIEKGGRLEINGTYNKDFPCNVDFSFDESQFLICVNGAVTLFSITEGKPREEGSISDSGIMVDNTPFPHLPETPGIDLGEHPEQKGFTSRACFSRDGRLILTETAFGKASIWDVTARPQLVSNVDSGILPEVPGEYNYVQPKWNSFLPQSRLVLTVYNVQSSPLLPEGAAVDRSFSGETYSIRIWDKNRQVPFYVRQHHDLIKEIVVSPDEQLILGLYEDGMIKVWDQKNILQAEIISPQGKIAKARFIGASGAYKVLTYDELGEFNSRLKITIWDLSKQGTLLHYHKEKNDEVARFSFLGDDKLIIDYAGKPDFTIWNLSSNWSKQVKPSAGDPMRAVYQVVASPDGKIIAFTNSFEIQLYDTKGTALPGEIEMDWDQFEKIQFINNHLLAVCYKTPKTVIYKISDQKILLHKELPDGYLLAISPDREMAVLALGQEMGIWYISEGRQENFGHPAPLAGMGCISPDNRYLVFVYNTEFCVWDIENKKTLIDQFTAHGSTIQDVVFLSGDLLVTASNDFTAKIWDVNQHKSPRQTLQLQEPVKSVVISEDRQLILTLTNQESVMVWNADGEVITEFNQHRGPVVQAAFVPGDANAVVTISEDKTIKMWPLPEKIHAWLKNDDCPLPSLKAFTKARATVKASPGG